MGMTTGFAGGLLCALTAVTMTFSTAAAGWSLRTITPRTLTVISGLLSATAGLLWLILFVTRRVRLPKKISGHRYTQMASD